MSGSQVQNMNLIPSEAQNSDLGRDLGEDIAEDNDIEEVFKIVNEGHVKSIIAKFTKLEKNISFD